MVAIREAFPSIDDASLQVVEEALGFTLPKTYRDRLMQNNGGYPEPADFDIGAEGASTVQYFLGVNEGDPDDLLTFNTNFKGRLPSGLLAVAYDPGGNLICLGVGGERLGQVFFWDHEHRNSVIDELPMLAPSFDSFLEQLHGPH